MRVSKSKFLQVLTIAGLSFISNQLWSQKDVFSVSVSTVSPTCSGSSDGSIHLTVTGGIPPYTYAWSNGAVTPSITNISAGTFSVIVIDAAQNKSSHTFGILQPAPISINAAIQPVTINGGNNGAIDLSVANTTGTNQYTWFHGNSSLNQNAEDISNLTAGSYTVIVTTQGGCVGVATFNVTQPPTMPQVINEDFQNKNFHGLTPDCSNTMVYETANNVMISSGHSTEKVQVFDSQNNMMKGLEIIPNSDEFQKLELNPGTYNVIFFHENGSKKMKTLKILG